MNQQDGLPLSRPPSAPLAKHNDALARRGLELSKDVGIVLKEGLEAKFAKLVDAARGNDVLKMKALLEATPGLVFMEGEEHGTALHWAACRGNIEACKLLLDAGADIEAECDYNGYVPIGVGTIALRPLHLAAWNNWPAIIELLVASGANLNPIDVLRLTPLHYATCGEPCGEKCEIEAMRMLLRLGADPNVPCLAVDYTPLFFAVSKEDIEAIKLLLQHGADVNAKNADGMTPFEMASDSYEPNEKVIRALKGL